MATAMVMVITAVRQIQNRRRREIIMVGRRVVIIRIIPRTPAQPRGQTVRRLRHHHSVRRHQARRSILQLLLPQRRKGQREDLTPSGSEENSFAAALSEPDWRLLPLEGGDAAGGMIWEGFRYFLAVPRKRLPLTRLVPGRREDLGRHTVFSGSSLAFPVSLRWMSGRIAPNARRRAAC